MQATGRLFGYEEECGRFRGAGEGREMRKPGKNWVPLWCDFCRTKVGYYNPNKIGCPVSVRCSSHIIEHWTEVSKEWIKEWLRKHQGIHRYAEAVEFLHEAGVTVKR